MDLKKVGNALLPVAGMAVALLANIIAAKNQDTQIKRAVAKEVAAYIESQTKES